MSVMECDREGCDEILCRRLVLNSSRCICENCYQELTQYKDDHIDEWETETDVSDAIRAFLRSEKGSFAKLVNRASKEAEFKRLTSSLENDEDDDG